MRIAFQGDPGAFSEEAAIAHRSDAETVGYQTLDAAADAAALRIVNAACLPAENTLFGSIGRTYDLIQQRGLEIIEARVLHVRQCLIAKNLLPVDGIRSVASHPVAIEQCRSLLASLPQAKTILAFDTAGAVRAMMDGSLSTDACIASAFAACRYGAIILRTDVQDSPANYTRFFLVSRRNSSAPKDGSHSTLSTHSTLCCELANEPGALRNLLSVFADFKINITNLVCRPIPSSPWLYRFFVEIEAGTELVTRVAPILSAQGRSMVCGCYNTHHSREM